jgi:hypothetical protein
MIEVIGITVVISTASISGARGNKFAYLLRLIALITQDHVIQANS